MKIRILFAVSLLLFSMFVIAQSKIPVKPRIIISSDIGGTDPDDNQSLAHFLMYSEKFNTEGIISSPSFGEGSKKEILRMIDVYEKDYSRLSKHISGLMKPDYLRSITKQGRKGSAPFCGFTKSTEGSEWIVKCARKKSRQPLWILVWGGLEDVAQALHDAPDIKNKIRIYWIGGPNKKWSVNCYAYIAEHFPDLWIIENNVSYRGFIYDSSNNDKYNCGYYENFIKGAGNLGTDFLSYYNGNPKLGDTPSLLYMMDGDPDNPLKESWGGSFEKTSHTSRIIFDRPATPQDSVPAYSVLEFYVKGPVKNDIAADSICFTLTIAKQKWSGYYLGNGNYAVRHSSYYIGTLPYTITSSIEGFPEHEGSITLINKWPGIKRESDYNLGNCWYTDRYDPELFIKHMQGAKTVYKWRNDAMANWGERWNWLK